MLTQTVLNGVFCIRFAIGAERTEVFHINQAFNLLQKEAELALGFYNRTDRGWLKNHQTAAARCMPVL